MSHRFSRFSRLFLVVSLGAASSGGPPLLHAQEEAPGDAVSVSGPLPAGADTLETAVVTGKAEDLLGIAPSASKGQASAEELQQRPFLRRGELLEVVPGMIVTQHSGGGKANQYFVRGFNLDHGTDFGIFVDAMPVNQRSHGHGQGYADINFIIPELVERLEYHKGPYFAHLGDFTSAGAARFQLFRSLPESIASFSFGSDDYYRGLFADSVQAGPGIATFALEYNYYDGPWVMPDELHRWNGLFRYALGDDHDHLAFTLMGHDSSWNASDQIPRRAVRRGSLDRFGHVDPTTGGDSHRYSLSIDGQRSGDRGVTRGSVYAGVYQLDLYSNFTYFLDDPERGDQFNQHDDRWFAGAALSHRFEDLGWLGEDTALEIGASTHQDWIGEVGLYHTQARRRIGVTRVDEIYQASYSGHGELETRWSDWLRSTTGLRGDLYHFDVNSLSLPANSGSTWDGIVSPKAGLVLGPWAETEFYLNGGLGFHSNDARGVTITRDPATGEPLDSVDPLVRSRGAEVGIRTQAVPDLTSTLAVFYLDSDSELIYEGDTGAVEAGDASRRHGVEWANYWRPASWIYLDTEFTATESRFKGSGEKIENAVPLSFAGGINFGERHGPFAGLRTRYFAPRPLNEDGSIKSGDAFQVNARAGYRKDHWEVALEVFNLFDARDNDIEYLYESRLPGEPLGGVEDVHLHPYEPRQLRLSLTYRW